MCTLINISKLPTVLQPSPSLPNSLLYSLLCLLLHSILNRHVVYISLFFFAVSNRIVLHYTTCICLPVIYAGEFLQVYIPEEIIARSLWVGIALILLDNAPPPPQNGCTNSIVI